ncbi:hypothetical protein ACPPVQ_18990 [Diaminobutyricibacter sp. McL0618]|uniref:hypothetical protein n=1 Tax=Leifsonia sp. McL0618 TaxID=3415677 RepID=UPI003CF87EEF
MTTVIWPQRETDAAPAVPIGRQLRTWTGAVAMVALFVLIAVTSAIDPVDSNASSKAQLAQAKAHSAALQSTIALEFLIALCAIGAVFAIVGAVGGRGMVLANIAAVVGAFGILGQTLIPVGHVMLLAVARSGASADVIDQFHMSAPPFTAVFLFAMPVALVLLAGAAWRARIVGWLPFALVALFFVLDLVGLPEEIAAVIGLVGFALIAIGLVRRPGL